MADCKKTCLEGFTKAFGAQVLDKINNRPRLTPAELDARLKFIIGCMLGFVLMITTIGVLWALVFVTQPIGAQAENDKMFFGVLSSVATFITGTLAGLMISTGRNTEDKNGNGIPDDEEQMMKSQNDQEFGSVKYCLIKSIECHSAGVGAGDGTGGR